MEITTLAPSQEGAPPTRSLVCLRRRFVVVGVGIVGVGIVGVGIVIVISIGSIGIRIIGVLSALIVRIPLLIVAAGMLLIVVPGEIRPAFGVAIVPCTQI